MMIQKAFKVSIHVCYWDVSCIVANSTACNAATKYDYTYILQTRTVRYGLVESLVRMSILVWNTSCKRLVIQYYVTFSKDITFIQ